MIKDEPELSLFIQKKVDLIEIKIMGYQVLMHHIV